MSYTPKILAFSGSARKDSFNQRVVQIAANGARAVGAEVTVLNFRDLPLPLYDQDLEAEQGMPQNVLKLKEIMRAHQGLLIASPEYNSSVTPLLKNAIDWASRPVDGEPPLGCFEGRVAAIMSASPGGLGGLRGLIHLRSILGNIRVIVLPDQVAVSHASEAFHPEGTLKEARLQRSVEQLGEKVATIMARLNG
jgi:NAD(P)H-dependent FMN reductase